MTEAAKRPQSKHGGKRPGSGRPKGSKDRTTREASATIGQLARQHAPEAIQTLVDIATAGESEAARVSAANALLDRGFGRPSQAVSMEVTGADGGPIQTEDVADARSLVERRIAGIAARAAAHENSNKPH